MRPTQSQIGEWLAARRGEAVLSQRQAAEYLDTDGGTVSRWERGIMPMSAESFLALVVLYGAEARLPELLGKRRVYNTPRTSGTTNVGRSNNSKKG